MHLRDLRQTNGSNAAHIPPPPFAVRPRMTHEELVALNHAALAILVRGQCTPRTPPRVWDGSDISDMRLHEENTVLVDMFQLVPSRIIRQSFVDRLIYSILVREHAHPYLAVMKSAQRLSGHKPAGHCPRSTRGLFSSGRWQPPPGGYASDHCSC